MNKRQRIALIEHLLGWFFFGGLVILVLIFYPQLPESVPSHFNIYGYPDGYNNKMFVPVITSIGLVSFLTLFFLEKWIQNTLFSKVGKSIPHKKLSYLVASLLRKINLLITGMFLWVVWAIIGYELNFDWLLRCNMPLWCLVLLFMVTANYTIRIISLQRIIDRNKNEKK